MEAPQTVFFIGKPGCGKGTQAKLLAEKTGWKTITSGEQIRATAAENTPVGQQLKLEADAGLLVPYWFANYLFLKNLFTLAADESVIFDGFNRESPEAAVVREALEWLRRPYKVIHLKVSDTEVMRRLALRKNIEHRVDDNAIDTRLKEYHAYTDKVIDMFRDAGILIEVEGEQPPAAITEEIAKALNLQ